MHLDLLFPTVKTAALYLTPIKSYSLSNTARGLLDHPVTIKSDHFPACVGTALLNMKTFISTTLHCYCISISLLAESSFFFRK